MFKGLDHLAIVVPDTEAALKIWRDRFGFPVVDVLRNKGKGKGRTGLISELLGG